MTSLHWSKTLVLTEFQAQEHTHKNKSWFFYIYFLHQHTDSFCPFFFSLLFTHTHTHTHTNIQILLTACSVHVCGPVCVWSLLSYGLCLFIINTVSFQNVLHHVTQWRLTADKVMAAVNRSGLHTQPLCDMKQNSSAGEHNNYNTHINTILSKLFHVVVCCVRDYL